MPSLHTFLAEYSRLCQLFGRSNLARAIEARVKDGSLYYVGPNERIEDAHTIFYCVTVGYMGEGLRIELHVRVSRLNEDEEEVTNTHNLTLDVPCAVADAYEIATEHHRSGGKTETMTFTIDQTALDAWVAERRTALYARRLTELEADRAKLEAAITELRTRGGLKPKRAPRPTVKG